jgi:CRISPR system Cascade subunit CasA
MNLTTEPWIPVLWDNGKPGMVSLADAFSRGLEIQDLSVRPHERIALLRLLICITQAALEGPADADDWKECRPRIVRSGLEYLRRWRHAFELFGSGQRFLQVSQLQKRKDDEGNSLSKLDVTLSTGNNPTLFDNAGGTDRAFSPAELAINLLTFQCFSPGGRIGVALWKGKETLGNGSSNHAPCIAGSMLHAVLRGQTLLETIHLNLLSRAQVEQLFSKNYWGQPVWEVPPSHSTDTKAVANATSTYLGRLVPLSRTIRLQEDPPTMILANGLKFIEWRESTATVVIRTVKGQSQRSIVRASLERAPWRELHSLTVKTISQNTNGGPLALQNLAGDTPFDLWVGGLAADQAKLLDTVESVFHVPAAMLTDAGQRTYEEGVRLAQDIEFRLRRAISTYHRELGDNLDRAEMRERRQRVQNKAMFHFWTDAERRVSDLLAVAENPALLGLNKSWRKTDWGWAVWRAALAAFERACPHETARQIRAYALGRKALFVVPTQPQAEEEAKS